MVDVSAMEVVERSSGFWVVDGAGEVSGPFTDEGIAFDWIECADDIGGSLGGIYAADVFCGDCIDAIKRDCLDDGTVAGMLEDGIDPADERTFDSDQYPKDCDVECEADSPQHCGGCSVFLENDLTTDGEEYVKEAVRSGAPDDIAVTVWMPFYDYIDYDEAFDQWDNQ